MNMKLKLAIRDIFWWFWAISLVFIAIALVGWVPGYYIVITISAVQLALFIFRERNLLAYPVQIRLVYFAWALTGLWVAGRLPIYILLFLGTFMVVFFGRCSISLLLKYLPWNRSRVPRLV
jgi:hypothetical protein